MNKTIQVSGKRKKAVARVSLKSGSGIVRVNKLNIENYEPAIARMKIKEPLLLAKGVADKLDISVNVSGGGFMGQAEAARLGIARALVRHNDKLKSLFLDYDRQLLVADVRRREKRKPNTQGHARSKKQKSYR